jgi:hypothetical protein
VTSLSELRCYDTGRNISVDVKVSIKTYGLLVLSLTILKGYADTRE